MREPDAPSHHAADGGFRNPWHGGQEGRRSFSDVLRWRLQRMRYGVAPDPASDAFIRAAPRVVSELPDDERMRITWVGHSSFLIQLPGRNVLTDPVWSERVSPVQWAGPRRLTPPAVPFEDLPSIDVVLLSHDHYDHLDDPTVRMLHRRFGGDITWVTPLGYTDWFGRRGIRNVCELDWWQDGSVGGDLHVRALPARHWSQRSMRDALQRLWCSYALQHADGARIYFGGDSGYGPFYSQIAEREAPFDVVLLPVGAYEPRWFMEPAHMNPEDAVKAYADLGGEGLFVPMHWGTFRLADDPPLEPPVRLAAAWTAAQLPSESLWIPQHGGTRILT